MEFRGFTEKYGLDVVETKYDAEISKHIPEHIKGDEAMSPLLLEEIIEVPDVAAWGISPERVHKKLLKKTMVEMGKIVQEKKPDCYLPSSYSSNISRHVTGIGYKGTAHSEGIFGKYSSNYLGKIKKD